MLCIVLVILNESQGFIIANERCKDEVKTSKFKAITITVHLKLGTNKEYFLYVVEGLRSYTVSSLTHAFGKCLDIMNVIFLITN